MVVGGIRQAQRVAPTPGFAVAQRRDRKRARCDGRHRPS